MFLINPDLEFVFCFSIFFYFVDVFQAEFWEQRNALTSSRLQVLADSLPSFVLRSRATSTNVKYKNAWLRWKYWERETMGRCQFPVSPFLL